MMSAEFKTIDVWMQHPTMQFSNHRMFDSLRRWTGQEKLTLRYRLILPSA